MLKYRLILGPTMIAALLLIIFADDRLGAVSVANTLIGSLRGGESLLPPGVLVFGVFGAVAMLGAGELCVMARAKGIEAQPRVLKFAAIATFASMYLAPRDAGGAAAIAWLAGALFLAFFAGVLRHACRQQTQGAIAAGAATVFSAAYLGILPGFFMLIREGHSAWMLAAIIMITKNCDTGAYTVGRLCGKRKLIPWLSPGKTVEGLFGGIAFSVITAVLLAFLNNHYQWEGRWSQATQTFTHQSYPLWFAAVLGVLLAVIGHGGDLLESLLKRDAGVKDSGTTIPGFGGVLDVIDSPLLIAPVAYVMLAMV